MASFLYVSFDVKHPVKEQSSMIIEVIGNSEFEFVTSNIELCLATAHPPYLDFPLNFLNDLLYQFYISIKAILL